MVRNSGGGRLADSRAAAREVFTPRTRWHPGQHVQCAYLPRPYQRHRPLISADGGLYEFLTQFVLVAYHPRSLARGPRPILGVILTLSFFSMIASC